VLRPDGEETLEARYVERKAMGSLHCKPHARMFFDAGYAASPIAQFQPSAWRPPAAT
jgi:hypothetical protein